MREGDVWGDCRLQRERKLKAETMSSFGQGGFMVLGEDIQEEKRRQLIAWSSYMEPDISNQGRDY